MMACWLAGIVLSYVRIPPGYSEWHANADGLSRQCGQCLRPGCPVSSADVHVGDADSSSELLDQPFVGNGRFHGCRPFA